jgi:hypothetical protein
MRLALTEADVPVVYWAKFREYGVRVLDGSSSSIELLFCPWCGMKLPGSLRDQWFDELERRGIDPGVDSVPEEFHDGRWYAPAGNVKDETNSRFSNLHAGEGLTWFIVEAQFEAIQIRDGAPERVLLEDLTFLVRGENENAALENARVIAQGKEHAYESATGLETRWRLVELTGIHRMIDQEFFDGTEVKSTLTGRED